MLVDYLFAAFRLGGSCPSDSEGDSLISDKTVECI